MSDKDDDLKIFSGNANRALSEEICQHLKLPLGPADVERFPGGETRVQIKENIRGKDVFIVQPVCANLEAGLSPNDALMELLILIDAARRASARRITAVLPYYGYARQDRKDQPRVPITAKLVANLISTAGASRVLSVDLHANQVQGFFDIPFDHLYSINVFAAYIARKGLRDPVVVSPDVGSNRMARAYAATIGAGFAVIDKRRVTSRTTEVMNVIGSVEGKDVVIVDDLVSTGSSLVLAATTLKSRGALDVSACVVHPVLADDAVERIERSPLSELAVTNTIPVPRKALGGKLRVLSLGPLLGVAIRKIHNEESLSPLIVNARIEG